MKEDYYWKGAYGYVTQSGYMGWIEGRYQLFPTEGEYLEYIAYRIEEIEEEEQSSSFF